MLNTEKSIVKNFKACCLKDGEELIHHFVCRSSKMKKAFVLAYTNQKRFLMGSVKLFGKMTLIDEFSANDVKHIEVGVKTAIASNYFLKINYKLQEDFFRIQMTNPSAILKEIYSDNPQAKPSYLEQGEFLEILSVKKDLLFFFASDKLLVLNFDGKNISVQEKINYESITDFDVYEQKIGNFKNLYLEIDSKPKLYLIDLLGTGDSYVKFFSDIFKSTTISKPVPSYMEDDETEIITFNITKQLGIGIKKKFRLASKNIYLLEKNDDGKLIPYEKIQISNIESIKIDTLGSSLKTGQSGNHEIIIKTKDGKKYNIWNTDQERLAANKALDYLNQNIK